MTYHRALAKGAMTDIFDMIAGDEIGPETTGIKAALGLKGPSERGLIGVSCLAAFS